MIRVNVTSVFIKLGGGKTVVFGKVVTCLQVRVYYIEQSKVCKVR